MLTEKTKQVIQRLNAVSLSSDSRDFEGENHIDWRIGAHGSGEDISFFSYHAVSYRPVEKKAAQEFLQLLVHENILELRADEAYGFFKSRRTSDVKPDSILLDFKNLREDFTNSSDVKDGFLLFGQEKEAVNIQIPVKRINFKKLTEYVERHGLNKSLKPAQFFDGFDDYGPILN